jgi:hypothetical protein
MMIGIDPASLPSDLPLRCRCGHVRGVASEVSPSSGFRFLCYCKDCQAFARFLERADVLDAAGGTDIFQMPPARVTLTAGADALRCLPFSSKVLRWYADCCRTPIGNTAADARFPVVAVIHCFMDHQADGRSRDAEQWTRASSPHERSEMRDAPDFASAHPVYERPCFPVNNRRKQGPSPVAVPDQRCTTR